MWSARLILTVGLAGCGSMGPTAENPCYVEPATWHADDPNPYLRMSVLNVGRACGVTVSTDRRPGDASGYIVEQPSHGRARARRSSDGVMVAEYQPTPGYAGADAFKAQLGEGGRVVAVTVRVQLP